MQQPVAQTLGFDFRELAGQEQALGPDDQVVREPDEFQPDAVVLEVSERQVAQTGVFVVADVIPDACAGAMVTLDLGDVLAGLVGADRLEAVAVVVGEGQLRAGVRALAPDEYPRPRGSAGQVEQFGDLADLPVGPLAAVLIDRRNPGAIGDLQDCRSDGLGEVIADREADPGFAAPLQQLVLTAAALGFVAFGVFAILQSRYRRM